MLCRVDNIDIHQINSCRLIVMLCRVDNIDIHQINSSARYHFADTNMAGMRNQDMNIIYEMLVIDGM